MQVTFQMERNKMGVQRMRGERMGMGLESMERREWMERMERFERWVFLFVS